MVTALHSLIEHTTFENLDFSLFFFNSKYSNYKLYYEIMVKCWFLRESYDLSFDKIEKVSNKHTLIMKFMEKSNNNPNKRSTANFLPY